MEDPTSELSEALYSKLSQHDALPYLFIGSGISRRYLGLPDWDGLLKHFSEESGQRLRYLMATAQNDYPTAASLLAKEFHDFWWTDDRYKDQVSKYEDIIQDRQGGLKVAVAEFINERDKLIPGVPAVDDEMLAREVELMKKAVVDGVITTNYDSLTDQLFEDFPDYVGQDELLLSDAQFIAETYKIHGSSSDPLSIVLTKEDYDAFSERNHYLAAKLLTIFAEHPIVFFGYSLSDKYLSEILTNIVKAVGPDRSGILSERMYFVEWNPDRDAKPILEKSSIERGGSIIPTTRIETYRFDWIWESISRLNRPYPAKVLRHLKKHVFDLVTNPDPDEVRESVIAVPIDGEDSEGLRVVFGVGNFSNEDLRKLSQISAKTLTREMLELDILEQSKTVLDSSIVLEHGIPDQIRPNDSTYLPVHKYLNESGRIHSNGEKDFQNLPEIIETFATKELYVTPDQRTRFDREVKGTLKTPQEVMASELSLSFKLTCLLLIDERDFRLSELRDVLIEIRGQERMRNHKTSFNKLICRYDRLKWG